jgi:hypothetical protein
MFSQRFPVNPGELPVSSRMGCGSPVDKRTWSAVAAEGRRQKRRTSAAEVTCRQGKPEAVPPCSPVETTSPHAHRPNMEVAPCASVAMPPM